MVGRRPSARVTQKGNCCCCGKSGIKIIRFSYINVLEQKWIAVRRSDIARIEWANSPLGKGKSMNTKLLLLGLVLPLVSLSAQSVTLTNATRGNGGYFEIGDSLQLNITGGLHLAAVTYTQVMNGVPSGPFSAGSTDSSGSYQLGPVTVTSGSLGTWSETWYVGGVQATPTLSFKVLGDPTTTITNNTRGGSILYVGDSFTFQLTGGYPSTSATYALTLNNAYQGILSGGTTDSTGTLTISGTIPSNPGDTGTNAETSSVAVFQATSQPINFSVTPGCQVALINYPGNPPRFYFDTTYWYYGGSMASTGIAAAASAWNGTGNGITLTNDSTGTLQTVDFYDDSSIAPLLGTDLTYNFDNGGSSCYDHSGVNCSGLCANSSKMYYSSIAFNPSGISSTATSLSIAV